MSNAALRRVLAATGFIPDGQPAPGLEFGATASEHRRGRHFTPDARWRTPSALTVYFKYENTHPDNSTVGQWRREIWNEGFAPLLWVVSPDRITLYNGFGQPHKEGDAEANCIETFANIESSLRALDALAGRIALETDQFWRERPIVDRKTSVDQRLLRDLDSLERDLIHGQMDRAAAQALIGRTIFTQYVLDRQILSTERLRRLCGHSTLSRTLRDRTATTKLFCWLSETFNGDIFPPSVSRTPGRGHLARVADFLDAVDPASGQLSFFPYQFDVIPVELISAIYEQFAHSGSEANGRDSAKQHGVHYTRLSVVSLVLDELMDELTGNETVLDLTCGSGIFLVEALRRLVLQRTRNSPTREAIRQILYEQVFGVDLSEAAIRVAAFSLYLAALELDPDPQPPRALRFEPLIGRTLFVGDARTIENTAQASSRLAPDGKRRQFDFVVGNPPWNFRGKRGTQVRRKRMDRSSPKQPRGEALDFVLRAADFSHDKTRFGVILKATPFFSASQTGVAATIHVLKRLSPITLVNLANLTSWLFETSSAPAVVLFARHRPRRPDYITVVQVPWSISGARTHTFNISPSDILALPLSEIEASPMKLKAAAVGRRRDLVLLDELTGAHTSLHAALENAHTQLRDGLTQGTSRSQTRDAKHLKGLAFVRPTNISPFHISHPLPKFVMDTAQWPRERDTYRAPLVLVKEMLNSNGRTVAAVSEQDLVYTDAVMGMSFSRASSETAHAIAAILSSSLASWFFMMTASEFGIWKRRLFLRDVKLFPVPALGDVVNSKAGQLLIDISKRMQRAAADPALWQELDEAVLTLYALDATDRIVVTDGLFRATWQWKEGRDASVAIADVADLRRYAVAFLSVVDGWLSARNERSMRAEIITVSSSKALHVVRFILENGRRPPTVSVIEANEELSDVLTRIGDRLDVRIATALSARRELRVHGQNEVVIVKPSSKHHWLGVSALDDADAVVAESLVGSRG